MYGLDCVDISGTACDTSGAMRMLLAEDFDIRVADWDGWVTLIVLGVGLLVMFRDTIKTEFIMCGMLLTLVWCRIISSKDAVEGFSSTGILTVMALFGVAEGIAQTRALDAFFKRVLGRPSTVPAALIRMSLPLAFWSAFLNNTPIVALMIPILVTWSRATKLPVSKFMMPLSYVAQLGSILTLIGTSTNLVIKEKYDKARSTDKALPDLTIFRQTPYALPVTLMGIVYIVLFGRWFLRGRNTADNTEEHNSKNEEEEPIQVGLIVTPKSPAIGKTIAEVGLAGTGDLKANRIDRNGTPLPVYDLQHRVIGVYDEVYVSGDMKQVDALAAQLDLAIVTDEYDAQDFGSYREASAHPGSERLLPGRLPGFEGTFDSVEWSCRSDNAADAKGEVSTFQGSDVSNGIIRLIHVTVKKDAPIVGLSVKEAKFRARFDAAVVDIRNNFRRVSGPLATAVLAPGHDLLLDTGFSFDSSSSEMQANFENVHFLKAPVKQFLTAIEIPQDSAFVGKTLASADLRGMGNAYVTIIQRGEKQLHAVDPNAQLEGGDVLWITGSQEAIHEIRNRKGLRNYGPQTSVLPVHRTLIQAVLSGKSPLLGQLANEADFEQFGVALTAIHRSGERLTHLADVRLRTGDCLLLEGSQEFVKQHEGDDGFVLLSPVANSSPVRWNRSYFALFLLVALVTAQISQSAAMDKPWIEFLPLVVTTLAIMLVTKCVSPSQLHKALKWDLYLTIASAIGLSNALEDSGAAAMLADTLVYIGKKCGGDVFIIAAMYIATAGLSNIIANNAVGALLFPIMQNISKTQGIKLEYLTYVLMFGASSAFSTPFGYQCNMMVQDVGGYASIDYIKFGGPFQVWQTFVVVLVMASPEHWYISLTVAAIICVVIFVPTLAGDTKHYRMLKHYALGSSGKTKGLDDANKKAQLVV